VYVFNIEDAQLNDFVYYEYSAVLYLVH